VVKLNRLLFDADVYHIHYDSAYSSYKVSDVTRTDNGDTYWYATPARNTTGFEAEGNVVVMKGLSLIVNSTFGDAKYEAAAATTLNDGKNTPVPASPVAWVASVAKDTFSGGFTYQDKGFDIGFFNKRIGPRYVDNTVNLTVNNIAITQTVNQATSLDPFWMNNLFVNYTLRSKSIFDQSKIKLSVNNLWDNHDIVGLSPGASGTPAIPFTPNVLDQLQLLPGRSVMITFQVGLQPRER
jgi:iron complex outermembrane receptor protein